MRFPVRATLVLLTAFLLVSCNHSDVTGPNAGGYVHIMVVNDSSETIFVPAAATLASKSLSNYGELGPGASGEIQFVTPRMAGGGFVVARSYGHNIAIVNFSFVHPPAEATGLNYAGVHVTANTGAPVTAFSDRTDLVLVTGVDPQ
jgi:hypothetical protein